MERWAGFNVTSVTSVILCTQFIMITNCFMRYLCGVELGGFSIIRLGSITDKRTVKSQQRDKLGAIERAQRNQCICELVDRAIETVRKWKEVQDEDCTAEIRKNVVGGTREPLTAFKDGRTGLFNRPRKNRWGHWGGGSEAFFRNNRSDWVSYTPALNRRSGRAGKRVILPFRSSNRKKI